MKHNYKIIAKEKKILNVYTNRGQYQIWFWLIVDQLQKQPLEIFCDKVPLKISQNSQEVEACNFIKKETLA